MGKKNNYELNIGRRKINFKRREIIKICLILEGIAYAIVNEENFDILDFYKLIPFKGAREDFRIYLCKFMEMYLNDNNSKKIIIDYMIANGMFDRGMDRKIMMVVDESDINDMVLEYIKEEKLPIVYGVCDIVNSFYNGKTIDLKEERRQRMDSIKMSGEDMCQNYTRKISRVKSNCLKGNG
jgi:hypothetical protein